MVARSGVIVLPAVYLLSHYVFSNSEAKQQRDLICPLARVPLQVK